MARGRTRELSKHFGDLFLWGARIWARMVREGRRRGREPGDRYHEVQYRDLVSAPDREVAKLESFTGASIDLEKLSAEGWNLLGRGNSAFESDLEGLSKGPIERWRQRLSDEELDLFEWAVGDLLEELSFPLAADGASPRFMDRLEWWRACATLRAKRWLSRNTPMGRLARRPLEIGLR